MALTQLPPLGKSIQQVVGPTFKLYGPLIAKNANTIRSVQKETFQYGPDERHLLDVYSAPKPSIVNGRKPVFMFEYGGGLVNGDRTFSAFADGLAYANLASFFALKFGYTVVIADYRLLKHGAQFPSGGEDIALAVEWICNHQFGPGSEQLDLYIMGNSAGGIHLSTFLLHSNFAPTRQKVLSGQDIRLRGAILLSVPFHFASAGGTRAETLTSYFGDFEAYSPLALLRSARLKGAPLDFIQGGTRVLVLNGALDPEDECLIPRDDFVNEWLKMNDNASRCALAIDTMLGHNHASPCVALSTGIADEEAWGFQVAAFCDAIRKFPLANQ